MNATTWKLFIIAFFIFLFTDILWLGYFAKYIYFQSHEPWLRLENGQFKPLWWAAFYGAPLGATIYGVYDFTCLAIFAKFPVLVGFIDWLWGTLLYAWSAGLTVYRSTSLRLS